MLAFPNALLEYNERELDAGYNINSNALEIWNPDLRATRKTERFKALVSIPKTISDSNDDAVRLERRWQ